MAVKWSKISPQLALAPAVAVTLVAFVGAILWTIFISFTKSRRFPEYTIDPEGWYRQYVRLFGNDAWATSLKNLVVLAIGSALAIVLGFILAAMVEREKRGEGVFRTIFLYPLAISLIVTGLVWRWMFNPSLGIQNFLRGLGWESANFNWLAAPRHRHVRDHPRLDLARHGLLHGADARRPERHQPRDLERGAARRRELLAALFEIIIPMMKFTFLTCAILLSLGVVKAFDIVVAMTNGGPGTSTWTPAYFAINAYSTRSNIGFASAAAVIMLLITLAIFLPLVTLTSWQLRRREAQVA